MDGEFVNLTPEDSGSEHLCCVIRLKTVHPGVEAKRAARRAVRPCGHARKGKIPALCVQQPGGVLWRKACSRQSDRCRRARKAPAEGSQRKPFLNGIRKARFRKCKRCGKYFIIHHSPDRPLLLPQMLRQEMP